MADNDIGGAPVPEQDAYGAVPEGGAAGAQPADDGVQEHAVGSLHDSIAKAYDESAAGTGEGGEQGTKPGETQPAGTETAETQPTETAAIDAPTNWPSAERERFAKLDPDTQKWLLGRSRGMEQSYARAMNELAPLRGTLEQWQPYFQQLGVPPGVAIGRLLETESVLRSGTNAQKFEILADLIQAYGITADEDGTVAQPDPHVAALTAQVQQMQGAQYQQAQAAQQAQLANAQGQLSAFVNEKGADGTLAHPYYADVEQDMTRLAQSDLASGVRPDLNSLYERACWGNPAVRAKLIEADNRAKVAAAKRASGQITGAGATPMNQMPRDLRGTIEANYDALAGA